MVIPSRGQQARVLCSVEEIEERIVDIDQILGLPAHPLLVHGVVTLIPPCAAGVALAALWPAARARLSLAVLVLTVFAVALVPLVAESGEWLEERVGETALLERHAELGEAFLPFAIALLVGAVAVVILRLVERRGDEAGNGSARSAPRWLVVLVIVVAFTTSAAAAYETYLVGHSGAVSVWSGVG